MNVLDDSLHEPIMYSLPLINCRVSIIQNSLESNHILSDLRVVEFENAVGLSFGLEAGYILPDMNEKWAIAVEPTYRTLRMERSYNLESISRALID